LTCFAAREHPCRIGVPRRGLIFGGRCAGGGGLAPATRARHLSALRSALAWWAEADWVAADPTAGWARPKVPVDTTRALTRAQVAAIWRLDVPLRDKALWRMLYETAARAEEILGLDVPDLDLPSKRGRIVSKGGTTDWVLRQTGTAMLLPPAPGRTAPGPGVPDGPQACPRGRVRRPVPGDPPGTAVLPAGRRIIRARDPAPGQPREPPPGSWRNCTAGPSISCGTPCSPTRPRTALAPPCCSPGPGTPPSAPSSATRPGPEAVARHVARSDPAARRRQRER
jgi:integrase/recombinase XerD